MARRPWFVQAKRFARVAALCVLGVRFAMRVLLAVLALASIPAAYSQDAYLSPLAPPDTSSPRATFESFRENIERAFRSYYEGRPRTHLQDEALRRAVACLDTSRFPRVRAERQGSEVAIMLNDVLDHVTLPPFDAIPDTDAMEALPEGQPRVWRVPGTEIEIGRIDEGPRAGEYLFTAETVDRVPEFYALSRDMPYKTGAMEELFARIADAPGPWIPERWIRALPKALKLVILEQAVWKWIAMVVVLVVWLLLVYAAHRVTRRKHGERRYFLRSLLAIALLPVTVLFRNFYEDQLLIVGPAYVIVDDIVVLLYYLLSAIAVINLGAAIASTITTRLKLEGRFLDSNFATVMCHSVAWLVAIAVVAKGVSDLGVPLAAVVTSLGVGGVAFALAAGPTLQNLIAGVTLYLDKPVKVGEFCQYDDVLGKVEHIGLRSTRIRRWGGNRLSVPNAQFAEFQLDNYNDARYIWIRQRLRLRYDTSHDQLAYILAKLREMLFAHPKVLLPRVRFIAFGDDALTVELLCYTDTGVWSEWHAIREDVLLRTMEIIESAGTHPALPSKTTYFTRDEGLDEEKTLAAEAQVKEWREKGELPFPDMSNEKREALEKTLQFPPQGSVQLKSESNEG